MAAHPLNITLDGEHASKLARRQRPGSPTINRRG
jgi:hypothetical protein